VDAYQQAQAAVLQRPRGAQIIPGCVSFATPVPVVEVERLNANLVRFRFAVPPEAGGDQRSLPHVTLAENIQPADPRVLTLDYWLERLQCRDQSSLDLRASCYAEAARQRNAADHKVR
jgi:hypothetical protein